MWQEFASFFENAANIPSSFIFRFQKVLLHIDEGVEERDLKVIQHNQQTTERAIIK